MLIRGNLDLAQIRLARGEGAERRQESAGDQARDRLSDQQTIPRLVHSLGPGRRGHAKKLDVRGFCHPTRVKHAVAVNLVEDDEIDLWEGFSAHQRVRGANLVGLTPIAKRVVALLDGHKLLGKPLVREHFPGLLDERQPRNHDGGPAPLGMGEAE